MKEERIYVMFYCILIEKVCSKLFVDLVVDTYIY